MALAAARSCPTICAPTSAALAHGGLVGDDGGVVGAGAVELAAAVELLSPLVVVYRSR